jgi:hypothetical protein
MADAKQSQVVQALPGEDQGEKYIWRVLGFRVLGFWEASPGGEDQGEKYTWRVLGFRVLGGITWRGGSR